MYNFTTDLREVVPFPVAIVKDNIITDVAFVKDENYEALDIVFFNADKGYSHRERIFSVGKEVPSWTTVDKEIMKLKSRVFHILERFYKPQEIVFNAESFEEMCVEVKALLEPVIEKKTKVTLKFIYNKGFDRSILPPNPPFITTEDEDRELMYSKWEKANRLLEEEDGDLV